VEWVRNGMWILGDRKGANKLVWDRDGVGWDDSYSYESVEYEEDKSGKRKKNDGKMTEKEGERERISKYEQ
jgi:hypothetical protein